MNQCPWAFPEYFAPIKISVKRIQSIKKIAKEKGLTAAEMLDRIIQDYLDRYE